MISLIPLKKNSLHQHIAIQAHERKAEICSVDVGSGYVKIASHDNQGLRLQSFVSIAVKASEQTLAADPISVRSSDRVYVNGGWYEVGEDAELIQSRGGVRKFSDDYAMSDEYLALFYGALAKIDKEHIDIMVVGLPIKMAQDIKRVELLKARLEGDHHITPNRKIHIDTVKVIGQPIGGLFDYLNRNDLLNNLGHDRFLVIDPGQYTFDWVTAQGAKPIEKLCGSHTISMRQIVQEIENNIGKHLGNHFSGATYVERALREGTINLKGQQLKIKQFIDEDVEGVIQSAVDEMMRHLDELEKIKAIILCGGGSVILKPFIEKAFKGYVIESNEEPFYNNVKGYQVIGCVSWIKQSQ